MSARFRLPAGRSYNVRATELERDRQHTQVVCNVLLLDNTVQAFKVSKSDHGQVLLDAVFKHLELTERDYFGLHLADDSLDTPRWLDPNKPIRKQLKRGSPHNLSFRVKFFVTDPSKLQEEYTRRRTIRVDYPAYTIVISQQYEIKAFLDFWVKVLHSESKVMNQEFMTRNNSGPFYNQTQLALCSS